MDEEKVTQEESQEEVKEETQSPSEESQTPANSQDDKPILVVEDDKFLRELLIRKLDSEKMDTVAAIDGSEAIAKAKEVSPKIILLDLILPSMDGFDVLKELKSDETTKDIPVIILSNLGQKEEVEKGLSLGAEDYLIKAHFTPDEIIAKIQKVIQNKKS